MRTDRTYWDHNAVLFCSFLTRRERTQHETSRVFWSDRIQKHNSNSFNIDKAIYLDKTQLSKEENSPWPRHHLYCPVTCGVAPNKIQIKGRVQKLKERYDKNSFGTFVERWWIAGPRERINYILVGKETSKENNGVGRGDDGYRAWGDIQSRYQQQWFG